MGRVSMRFGSGELFVFNGEGVAFANVVNRPDMHLMVWRSEDLMSWTITHKVPDALFTSSPLSQMSPNIALKDTGTATESWHNRTAIEDVLKYTSQIPGWPEIMNKVIRTTPKDGITDWKLMWRDPQPQWTSPGGRVVQLGDAAHTFVPSAGNGATQAMEDAVCLATCLQLGGKSNIPLAVKVHNKLR
jgi:2-polyprenyl-6-methoxyphenol hydroxylase-like FAD-dependent oxidoreductase